jgi:hypothetical protein
MLSGCVIVPSFPDTELPYFPAISVVFVSVGTILAWGPLFRLNRQVRFTTLSTACGWTLAAAILWTLTWILDPVLNLLSKPVADHLWYASAVVALCPAIAVLGARRPGTRVWNWFILLPLLFALGWPVLTLLVQNSDVRGLQLETPQLVGYLLVLVMGAGNYFGTRYTLSGLLYAVANACLIVSNSTVFPIWLSDRWWARCLATGGVALAVLFAAASTGGSSSAQNRFDRLWLDFFDQFGVVWGRRIQDRVNFMAAKEAWPARLELHGVHWNGPPDLQTEARIEHTFRWLLRRFVDPQWIDLRLGAKPVASEITPLSADS